MPEFRIRVVRFSHLEEVGYLLVGAEDIDSALEAAAEMDDPDIMEESWSESQSHDYFDAS